MAERRFPEEDHAIQTFFFNGTHEAFGKCIQVRTADVDRVTSAASFRASAPALPEAACRL
jgi:hypothetical protein